LTKERRKVMNNGKVIKRGSVGLICLAVILWAGYSFAQSELIDVDEVGQITEAVSTSGLPLVLSGPLELKVLVDQTICGTGAVQCTGSGHTTRTAAKNNHNPVRVIIQVLDENRIPVTGLTAASFGVSTPFVPAGGPGLTRLDCGLDCFQASPDGVYGIFVHPAPASTNWKSGSYCLQVQATVGSLSVFGIVLISIP
jgi:hypothetical protein